MYYFRVWRLGMIGFGEMIEEYRWSVKHWFLRLYCRISGGHPWVEHLEYEDAGYPVHCRTWRECLRCESYEELWSIYDR